MLTKSHRDGALNPSCLVSKTGSSATIRRVPSWFIPFMFCPLEQNKTGPIGRASAKGEGLLSLPDGRESASRKRFEIDIWFLTESRAALERFSWLTGLIEESTVSKIEMIAVGATSEIKPMPSPPGGID